MNSRVLVAMPMKPFDQAKSRLADVMPREQRERLARVLFLRTQRFFATHFGDFDRLVVTPSQGVKHACRRIGAECLMEPGVEGMNVAAMRAIGWAAERGYSKILLIPGDVPVWMRSEVHMLIGLGNRHDVVIARARDGGTNALLLGLPNQFQCSYGSNSSLVHQQAALDAGLTAWVCKPPFLAHDLDVPADCPMFDVMREQP
jgi:2-phospho-L-lactate guanylyltransferase